MKWVAIPGRPLSLRRGAISPSIQSQSILPASRTTSCFILMIWSQPGPGIDHPIPSSCASSVASFLRQGIMRHPLEISVRSRSHHGAAGAYARPHRSRTCRKPDRRSDEKKIQQRQESRRVVEDYDRFRAFAQSFIVAMNDENADLGKSCADLRP